MGGMSNSKALVELQTSLDSSEAVLGARGPGGEAVAIRPQNRQVVPGAHSCPLPLPSGLASAGWVGAAVSVVGSQGGKSVQAVFSREECEETATLGCCFPPPLGFMRRRSRAGPPSQH